jgi:TolB-like protein/DNA-binding winged helix-turn-helix (wHTH) protein/Flp pilus assembly protein TadD
MSLQENNFRFGDFVFDADEMALSQSGKPVSLPPKALKLLSVLLENHGRIVEKEALMREVWEGAFVEEGNITYTVRLLRKTFNDDKHAPHYIETVPKRGYRFIGPLQSLEKVVVEPPKSVTATQRFRRNAVIGFAIIIAVVLGAWLLWPRPSGTAQPSERKMMLAVLPFQNLTGDDGQEYFSDGLTEEMITRLGNIEPNRLGVIARTSVMHYKNNPATIDQIGRELQVQYVLEGSVRRDANRVRIAAQLIQTSDQTHVWAREYDREITDLLSLQDEIAQEVAVNIQSTLGTKEQHPTATPEDFEAYDLYLKGQYFFNKRGAENLQQAIGYFGQSINKDPNYARAYAGQAASYALLSGYSAEPQSEFIAKARGAADQALAIDPNLSEAHTALALIVQNYDWDWQTSETEFKRAIELNPNYATAHHWYAEHLALLGRFDEALHESELARRIDPLSQIIATDNGEILHFSRQYDLAIQELREVEEMEPGLARAHIVVHVYVEKGMFKEALADIEQLRRTSNGPWISAETAYVYGRSGRSTDAQRVVDKLLEMNKNQPIDASLLVWAYTGMGNKEQAFAWLEKAYDQHSNILTRLKVDPAFDSLRDDPRFQDLLARVHLTN